MPGLSSANAQAPNRAVVGGRGVSLRGTRDTRPADRERSPRGVWRASSGRSGTRTRRRTRSPAAACHPQGAGAAVARSASGDPLPPCPTRELLQHKRKE